MNDIQIDTIDLKTSNLHTVDGPAFDAQKFLDGVVGAMITAPGQMVDEGIILETQLQLVQNFLFEKVNMATDAATKTPTAGVLGINVVQ